MSAFWIAAFVVIVVVVVSMQTTAIFLCVCVCVTSTKPTNEHEFAEADPSTTTIKIRTFQTVFQSNSIDIYTDIHRFGNHTLSKFIDFLDHKISFCLESHHEWQIE